MALHPSVVVPRVIARHGVALSTLHGYIEAAVPDTYARLSDLHSDPEAIHGMVLCTNVRDAILKKAENDGNLSGLSLEISEGPARSVVLSDGPMRIRVRKYPTDRTGVRVRVTPLALEPTLDEGLFGPIVVKVPYELYVLWSPHKASATLDERVLAAVADIDGTPQIFFEAPLPAPLQASAPPPPLAPMDDFDEELGDEELPGEA